MNHEYEAPLGPFAALYEEWVFADRDRRDPVVARLATTYREAWAAGDWQERFSVLSYVFDQRETGEGLDLVVEGLNAGDRRLARHAAAHASYYHRKGLIGGPSLRRAFRALVRRFPENSALLPREFLCYEAGDEDDRDAHPFVHLYEAWIADHAAREGELFDRLVTAYRGVWESGDFLDRAYVLHFLPVTVLVRKGGGAIEGADLVVEALKSDDERLAPTAPGTVWSFLDYGIDLGSDIRQILIAHRERFPENASLIGAALHALDAPKHATNQPTGESSAPDAD